MLLKIKSIFQTKHLWLIFILMLNLGFAAYFCNQKHVLFVDEGFSYGKSNGTDMHLPNITENELCRYNPSVFHEQFTVQPEEVWQYKQIFGNLENHPPLYNLIFHAINSFATDVFTKWTGLGFNLVMFLLTQIALYALSRQFLCVQKSYLPVIFYGFSVAAVCTVVFIRSYMLFTFQTTLLCLLAVKLLKATTTKAYALNLSGFCAALFFGFLTHYYFLITAGILCAGICVILLYRKMYLKLSIFIATALLSFCLCPLIFPSVYEQLLFGQRSREISATLYENIANHGFSLHVWNAFINANFLGYLATSTSVFSLIMLIFAGIYGYKKRQTIDPYIALLAVVLIFSVLIISVVMPIDIQLSDTAKRYFLHLSPLFALMFTLLMNIWASKLKYGFAVLLIIFLCLLSKTLKSPDFSIFLFNDKYPEAMYAHALKDRTLWIKWSPNDTKWKLVEAALYSFYAERFIIFRDTSSDCYQQMLHNKDAKHHTALIAENPGKKLRDCERISGYMPAWATWSVCMYFPNFREQNP